MYLRRLFKPINLCLTFFLSRFFVKLFCVTLFCHIIMSLTTPAFLRDERGAVDGPSLLTLLFSTISKQNINLETSSFFVCFKKILFLFWSQFDSNILLTNRQKNFVYKKNRGETSFGGNPIKISLKTD